MQAIELSKLIGKDFATCFARVEAGQTVRVLRNGKPIAEIHPIPPQTPSWKQRSARPLAIGGKAISQLILDERGD
ncbi:prevent-host-death family protein [mine drainage metagenome]|uniref:Prevent-host-death family protein n=1 Tax=mine drainage metagenome TaxID=410659 RepID=T1CDE1_9ZZZZ